MPTAYLYARLSSEESSQFCQSCKHNWTHYGTGDAICPKCKASHPVKIPNSIESQADRMHAWCIARWPVESRPSLMLIKDNVSGGSKFSERDHGSTLMDVLQEGDFVIMVRLDRGWRSARDFHETVAMFDEKKATLILIEENYDGSTAIGRFMAGLSALLAQLERERTSERQRASVAMRKAQGRSVGNPPYGKRIGICQTTGKKIIKDDEQELRMIKWVYVMRYKKRVPWNVMVTEAAKLGFSSRSGKMFSASHFRALGKIGRVMNRSGVLDKIS